MICLSLMDRNIPNLAVFLLVGGREGWKRESGGSSTDVSFLLSVVHHVRIHLTYPSVTDLVPDSSGDAILVCLL
jgi:hypothetical protein